MTTSILIILFGGLMALAGFAALRRPSDDSISLGEAIAWKASGEEPLPKSRFLRIYERGLQFLVFALGFFLLILGIASLFTEF